MPHLSTLELAHGQPSRLSARGRLAASVLALADLPESDATLLAQIRVALDEVIVSDARFPLHLAAYVKERTGRSRVAVALLVEASNRLCDARRRSARSVIAPAAMRSLMQRVLQTQPDAAYAMAWQVRHFGWTMPAVLRGCLTDVLQRTREERAAEGGTDAEDPTHSTGLVTRELEAVLGSVTRFTTRTN